MIEVIAPRVETLIVWSIETTAVALALALVAAFADRWKKLGPAARHALWLVILVKLVTPPVVQWPWSRPWSVPSPVVARVDEPPPAPTAIALKADRESSVDEAGPIADAEIVPVIDIASVAFRPEPGATNPAEEPAIAPIPASRSMIGLAAKGFAAAWLFGSVVVGLIQARKIGRFHLRARRGISAPDWLVEETAHLAELMSVRAPSVRMVADLSSPMIWCFGRPALLVPEALVKTMGVDRWRCVLAHELAHLRRGDHWVSRLELIAGIAWWWNPVFWWARRRVDAEAELACDAWVVATLPCDRITFAESLVRICSVNPSLARNPAPSVGVAGSGRDFERRLTMILNDRVSARPSLAAVFAAALLAALAVPSWTMAKPAAPKMPTDAPAASAGLDLDAAQVVAIDDDDDDDEKAEKAKKEKAEVREKKERVQAQEKKERAEVKERARAEQAEKKAKYKAKVKAKKEKGEDPEDAAKAEAVAEAVEKVVRDALGPDFEKKMEAFGKEMEKKFGPGSDFEKQMETFGKEMEKQMGPGSDFEKQMEAFGKAMEKKFGPGSDFEKQMKEFGEKMGKEMEGKFGPRSEKIEKIKGMKAKAFAEGIAEADKARAEAKRHRTTAEKGTEESKAKKKGNSRDAQVQAIEAQIRELSAQLKKLKAEGDNEEENDEDGK